MIVMVLKINAKREIVENNPFPMYLYNVMEFTSWVHCDIPFRCSFSRRVMFYLATSSKKRVLLPENRRDFERNQENQNSSQTATAFSLY